jgi:transaldolase
MSDSGSRRMRELLDLGQSVWLDYISRDLMRSGKLSRFIAEDSLRGMTSNPSIFQKAIGDGGDYDVDILPLAEAGLDAVEIFDRLAIADVREACDAFAGVYGATGGVDGYVSIEVAPKHAHDAPTTLSEAHRLAEAVGRPNVMVKIPATKEGMPAIRQALADGLNINITLMFSLGDYEAVAEAYLQALEERVAAGRPLDGVHSVASFFVSRIDTLVDSWLEERAQQGGDPERLLALRGKLGVANSGVAYERFQEILGAARWRALADRGATVQRMLWASTSTKNPAYSDLLYVDPLIGPHTVNTLPEPTFEAFKDHGSVARTVDRDVEGAHAHMRALAAAGIDVDAATAKLQVDGVALFAAAYDDVVAVVDQRRRALLGR